MEFFIYSGSGELVCSILAFRIEDVAWHNFKDLFVTGGYFVVGKERDRIIDTYFVNMIVTDDPERVMWMGNPAIEVNLKFKSQYSILVGGMFDSREDKIRVEVPGNRDGHIPELPGVVKFFKDRGKRVFCEASGRELEYVYPLKKVEVTVTSIGGKV